MYIDYVRVYQREGAPGIGCSPENYPTASYINKCAHRLSFYFCFSTLTGGQTSECLFESEPHNLEPSWVLLPAQFIVQWLLDLRPVPSWFFISDYFP